MTLFYFLLIIVFGILWYNYKNFFLNFAIFNLYKSIIVKYFFLRFNIRIMYGFFNKIIFFFSFS